MTLSCSLMSMLVAFPVDHRYGWDLSDRRHQTIVNDIAEKMKVYMSWFSPRCSPWSRANKKNQTAKAKARMEEHPTLTWATSRCRHILDSKTYKSGEPASAILETPHGSGLLDDSPFAAVYTDKRTSAVLLDQCQHGAMDQDARGLPNRKRTWLISFNFTVSPLTAAKCEGEHRCPEHGELRGKIPGTSLARTALSAVYPWNLCFSVMQDILTNLKTNTSWPLQVHWACARCKHGLKLRNGQSSPPHTYTPGCRYNKEKIPPGGVILSPDEVPRDDSSAASPAAPSARPSAPPASSSSSSSSAAAPRDASASSLKEPLKHEPNSAEGELETEVKVIQDSDYIEPSFNIRDLKKKLLDAALTTKQRLKHLLGLHYKMRHLPAAELKRMLLKRRLWQGKCRPG